MKWIVSGEGVEEVDARIPVRDRGALFGDGLFETFRVERGIPLFLEEHLDRLIRSAKTLRFARVPGEDELKGAIREAIRLNGVGSGYLRLTLTRGDGGYGIPLDRLDRPRYWVEAGEQRLDPGRYEQGIPAVVSFPARNPASPISGHKTLHFLESLLAKDDAEKKGAREAILRTMEGDLSEGASSNLFLVTRGTIRTPGLDRAPLPGVARAWTIRTARRLKLPLEETRLETAELWKAEEVFFTNSTWGPFPCREIDGCPVGDGTPGPVTRRLIRAWREDIDRQTRR
ncbi:aminotransferase class IV [Melghirimyces profundicolus]|uniref:aminotransferase class IV n=1 Tax=Melghirimyces profundicolus TaxID=1242148 RepID=UPI0014727A5B|nr:aminotransferase class IV [Melghirimyces profundicolus]